MDPLTIHGTTYEPDTRVLRWECKRCSRLWALTPAHVLVVHSALSFRHCAGCQCVLPACPGSGTAPGTNICLSVPGEKPLHGDIIDRRWFSLVNDPIVPMVRS